MRYHRDHTRRLALAALMGAVLATGCEVINPGPVGDEFIDLPASQAGLVNGSWERMNRIIVNGSFNEAMAAREIFHGGQTGSHGHGVARQAGNMGGWGDSGPYNNGQQARWIAEEAIRRFEARGDVDASMMTRAYVAAGYANRVNGDYFCWGVIDSGPLVEGAHYWERAEGHFTNAIATAPDSDQLHQAYAGRAQARLALEDWAGALADARQVPTDFELDVKVDFSQGGSSDNHNLIFWANGGGASAFRSFTIRFTYYDQYYTKTGDPRTRWREFPTVTDRACVGGLQGFPGNVVPCTQQQKYTSRDDDIAVSTGAEMRLIEAEAMMRLNPGSWPQAMEIINANRTRYVSDHSREPLEPWTANNLDEAWSMLMRERGMELWLEGRRFADMRRWERYIREYGTMELNSAGVLETLELPRTTPGTLDWPCFECVMTNPAINLFTQNLRGRPAIQNQSLPRELCYNISNTERNNNPNFRQDEDEEP
jgi:starch-binding outer membrane protein, SusD/RagB family